MQVQRFLSQPFFVAEIFTGTPGAFVDLETTSGAHAQFVDSIFGNVEGGPLFRISGWERLVLVDFTQVPHGPNSGKRRVYNGYAALPLAPRGGRVQKLVASWALGCR